MLNIFNPLDKEQQGGNCWEEMHKRYACGMREGCYVGYEDDKLACERFLGATSSLQHQRGCVCLQRVAWKKASKLQVDYGVKILRKKT